MTTMEILQYANRLEDSSSNERLEAINKLSLLSKTNANIVGEHAIPKLLNILREQCSLEEYQDVLELLNRLLSSKDNKAAMLNSTIILSDNKNIDLLLDLLEHDDYTVGVMTSQILTDLYNHQSERLEQEIQLCPDGLNKLLRRLPDNSREEVRDQSLVIVQQLTRNNDEMRKNFVFNEGFEIVFRIINSEGGPYGASVVIQDCIRICKHVLNGSDICQRLFYGMGNEWIRKLSDFFNPNILENLHQSMSLSNDETEKDNKESIQWYEQSNQVICCVLAINTFVGSLKPKDEKHQNILASINSNIIMYSLGYWIAKKGPRDVVNNSIDLLNHIINDNKKSSDIFSQIILKLSFDNSNKSGFLFGIKSSSNEIFIPLPNLLIERYIYPEVTWTIDTAVDDVSTNTDITTLNDFAISCMNLFENYLSNDQSYSDLLIQFILAPLPPSSDDLSNPIDSLIPLGVNLLRIIIEGCGKLLIGNSTFTSTAIYSTDQIIRSCNVMTSIYTYGSVLSKELSTAITTSHIIPNNENGIHLILPYLLSLAGRAARLSGGTGYNLLLALLRMLAVASSGCERVARQVLDDPSNLFVVDLASTTSENTGIPADIQLAACYFIGACLKALHLNSSNNSNELLTVQSFLSMIDSKIGLQRFLNILKQPTVSSGTHPFYYSSNGFKQYYENDVTIIRKVIFDYYTGSNVNKHKDSVHSIESYEQIVQIQQEKINELENQLLGKGINPSIVNISEYEEKIKSLENELLLKDNDFNLISISLNDLTLQINERDDMITSLQKQLGLHSNKKDYITSDEIMKYKEQINQLNNEKQELLEKIIQKDKKINLLEDEMKNPLMFDKLNEKKVNELETRNSQLKQMIWQLENDSINNFIKSKEYEKLNDCIRRLSKITSIEENIMNKLSINNEVDFYLYIDNVVSIINTFEHNIKNVIITMSDMYNKLEESSNDLAIVQNNQTINTISAYYQLLIDKYSTIKETLNSNSNLQVKSLEEVIKKIESENMVLSTNNIALNQRLEENESYISSLNSNLEALQNSLNDSEKEKLSLQSIINVKDNTIEMTTANLNSQIQILNESINDKDNIISTLNDSIETFKIQSTYKDNAIEKLNIEIHNHLESISNLNSKIDNLSNIIVEKDNMISSFKIDIDKLSTNLNTFTEELRSLNENLIEKDNLVLSLQSDVIHWKDQYDKLNEVIELNEKHIESQNDNTNKLYDQIDNLNNEINDKDDLIKSLNLNINDLKNNLNSYENVSSKHINDIEQYQNQINTLIETISNQDNEIQRLNDLNNKINLITNESIETNKDINNYKKQINELNDQIVSNDIIISDLNKELELLKNLNQLSDNTISEKEIIITDLKVKLSNLEKVISKLNDDISYMNTNIVAKDKNIQELDKKIIDLSQNINEQTILINDLKMIIDTNKKDFEDKKKSFEDEIVLLKDLISQYKYENESLTNKLDNSDIDITCIKDDYDELNNTITSYEIQINNLNNEINNKNNVINDLNNQIDQFIYDLNRLQNISNNSNNNEINNITNELNKIKDELIEKDIIISNLNNEINNYCNNIKDLENNNEKLINDLSLNKLEYNNLINEIKILNDKLIDYEKNFIDLSDNNTKLIQINNELNITNQNLQNKQNELNDLINQLNIENKKNINDNNNLINQNNELLNEINQLKELNNNINKKYNDLMNEYDRIKLDNNELNILINNLKNNNIELINIQNNIINDSMLYKNEIEIIIQTKDKLINELNNKINNLENNSLNIITNDLYNNNIEKYENQIKSLNGLNDGLKKQLQSCKIDLNNKEELILQYKDELEILGTIRLELIALETWIQDRYNINVSITTRLDNPKDLAIIIEDGILDIIEEFEVRLQQYSNNSVEQDTYINDLINRISELEKKSLITTIAVTSTILTSTTVTATTSSFTTTPAKSINTTNYVTTPENNINLDNSSKFNNTSSTYKSTTSKWSEATKSTANLSPRTKEMAKIQSEIVKERRKLFLLQEEHNDLLGLLAQQELELSIFKATLEKTSGISYVLKAEEEAQLGAIEKYGGYVDFRRSNHHDFDNSMEMIR